MYSNTIRIKYVIITINNTVLNTLRVNVVLVKILIISLLNKPLIYITNNIIIDKGWTRAYDVKVGDKMISSNNEVVTIRKIDLITYDTPINTYNLTVEGNNNYFVTYSKVLVHNSPV